MQRLSSKQRNTNIRRERDFRELSRLALLLCCGLVLAVGFVFAARQHFVAVQYGYENENLRSELASIVGGAAAIAAGEGTSFHPGEVGVSRTPIGIKAAEGRTGWHPEGKCPEPATCGQRPLSILPLRLIASVA